MAIEGPKKEGEKNNKPKYNPNQQRSPALGSKAKLPGSSPDNRFDNNKAHQEREKLIYKLALEHTEAMGSYAKLPRFPENKTYTVQKGLTDKGVPVTLFSIARSIIKSLPETEAEYKKISLEKRYITWEQCVELKKTPALFVARAMDTFLIAKGLMPKHEGLEPLPPAPDIVINLKEFFLRLTESTIRDLRQSEGTLGAGRMKPTEELPMTATTIWKLANNAVEKLSETLGKRKNNRYRLQKESFMEIRDTLPSVLFFLTKIESQWIMGAESEKAAKGLVQARRIGAEDVGLLNTKWMNEPSANMLVGAAILNKYLHRFKNASAAPFLNHMLKSQDKQMVELRKLYKKEEIINICKTEKRLLNGLASYNVGEGNWGDYKNWSNKQDQVALELAATRYVSKFLIARKKVPVPIEISKR